MAEDAHQQLLAKLAGLNESSDREAWEQVSAAPPQHEESAGAPLATDLEEAEPVDEVASPADSDSTLSQLLQRVQQLADGEPQGTEPDEPQSSHGFVPTEPKSIREAGLTVSEVEGLVLKYLLSISESSGRDITVQVKLPFRLIEPLLQTMKNDQVLAHRGAAPMNDYVYVLTEKARERARRLTADCTYFGAAPVPLGAYIESVEAQSLVATHPTEQDLARAFEDLLIDKRMLRRLGPAINSGRGLFLYGAPGNGKTSIAERVTKAFGDEVWIPRAIGIDGEVIRVFDPRNHQEVPLDAPDGLIDQRKIDKRWVRIKRPTIVVGGELTMENLELTIQSGTGISEAPLQMKSNCGTLVIDDFGRQRMSTDELLNRWIVPLEKRYDFLNLGSGKKVQVPFDQLIVFSTNLEPRDLVDDAFLRRIPYKIEVVDPTEEAFRELFSIMAPIVGVEYDEDAVNYLIETHYRAVKRPFRCCQPRDLLLQVSNTCKYRDQPAVMTRTNMDDAVENYFAVM